MGKSNRVRRPALSLVLALLVPLGAWGCAPADLSRGRGEAPTTAAARPTHTGEPLESAPTAPKPQLGSVHIEGIPHLVQKPDFCGEACAAMWLQALGHDTDQDAVFDATGLSSEKGRGAWTRELATGLETIGFDVGPVWTSADGSAPEPELDQLWRELHADLVAGVPSIVCTRFDESPDATEHFRLVVGYDADTDEVIYHDPALEQGADLRMERSRFFDLWQLHTRDGAVTLIRLRLASGDPRKLAVVPPSETPTAADYAQRVMALRQRVGEGFAIVVEPPFVVIGDEPAERVRRHAEGTVRWAVAHLRADYFERDPSRILEVWLFANADSYERNALALFAERPSTPYGYYSDEHDALVMNIATGGGTLVHEIVHPYIEANFPDCPAWFNEGLASLYEQSAERDGHIVGATNWRLAGLQEAIDDGTLPSFYELIHSTTDAFYADPTGYAQARYLLYDLQEQGLLHRYYRAFRARSAEDPSGWEALQEVLGTHDMAAFQRAWEVRTSALTFP